MSKDSQDSVDDRGDTRAEGLESNPELEPQAESQGADSELAEPRPDPGEDGSESVETEAFSRPDVDPQQAELPPTAAGASESNFAHWLAGGLQPSSSKSVPPAPTTVALPPETPETLAPQVMASSDLDAEDLAVLPNRRKPGQLLAKASVAALGVAAALLMFGYAWWQQGDELDAPTSVSAPEAAAAPRAGVGQPASSEPSAPTATDEQSTVSGARGLWLPPATDEEQQLDTPWGPSVGRMPDLPPEVWSRLRKQERERAKSGNTRPEKLLDRDVGDSEPALAADAPAPPPAVATPVIPAPVVPAPTVPAPTLAAPAIPAPTIPAPVIPAPVIPAPTVQAPVIPAPTVPPAR